MRVVNVCLDPGGRYRPGGVVEVTSRPEAWQLAKMRELLPQQSRRAALEGFSDFVDRRITRMLNQHMHIVGGDF